MVSELPHSVSTASEQYSSTWRASVTCPQQCPTWYAARFVYSTSAAHVGGPTLFCKKLLSLAPWLLYYCWSCHTVARKMSMHASSTLKLPWRSFYLYRRKTTRYHTQRKHRPWKSHARDCAPDGHRLQVPPITRDSRGLGIRARLPQVTQEHPCSRSGSCCWLAALHPPHATAFSEPCKG